MNPAAPGRHDRLQMVQLKCSSSMVGKVNPVVIAL